MEESTAHTNLIDRWLSWAHWSDQNRENPDENPFGDAFMEFMWLVQDEPDKAWELLLAMLADSRSESIMSTLAAGPMEDLICYHGEALIERIEKQAAKDPRFAKLLGGVWQSSTPSWLWDRITAVWDRRGWDGIPTSAA